MQVGGVILHMGWGPWHIRWLSNTGTSFSVIAVQQRWGVFLYCYYSMSHPMYGGAHRRVIVLACMTLAEAVGPTRCEVELLPQCWEQVRAVRRVPSLVRVVKRVSSLYACCSTTSYKVPSISVLAWMHTDVLSLCRLRTSSRSDARWWRKPVLCSRGSSRYAPAHPREMHITYGSCCAKWKHVCRYSRSCGRPSSCP